MTSSTVALIGDLVGSREHPSRRVVQEGMLRALDEVNRRVEAVQPLEPTIGDELQGVLGSVGDALLATLVLRLALPADLDVRCGLGAGRIEVVGASAYGLTQDGPAWWAARAAVDSVKARERRLPALRTWLADPDGPQEARMDHDLVNAYVLCRDEIVTALDARGRRLALGLLDGRTHADLARAEGVSASAISQRVRRDGLTALVASAGQVAS